MSCDYNQLPHPGIQTLSPYVPGKSIEELAKEQGLTNIIKLASNENPRGCSPLVSKALAELRPQQIATYPIPSAHPLPESLTKKLGIELPMLTLGHGSDALFQLLIICFALHRDKHIITHDHAFQTYQILANIFGVPLISTPLKSDFNIDIDAMITACNEKTALIFIANPNNPTGTLITRHDLIRLLTHVSKTSIVVLDEAYYEYLNPEDNPNAIGMLGTYSNLVITRTFSKAHGLAGLRLGYAVAHPDISALLHKIVLPFTISQTALAGGLAALEDETFVKDSVALNQTERPILRNALINLGFDCLPSFANFVTFDCKQDGRIIYNALLKKGVIVRPLHAYALDQYLRVTIGTAEQNKRFVEALKSIT